MTYEMVDDEPPWSPDDIIETFINEISKQREEKSAAWINFIENSTIGISKMTVVAANNLHKQISNPPQELTDSDAKKLEEINGKIIKRLNELNIEWLVEKFKELSPENKTEFLQIAQKILKQN
ncbi:hypothetical protein WDW89_23625 [Deltaproteobacteria bacterium TL4]